MERPNFPEPFFIAGVFSSVSSNQTNNYTTAFSARNNHILLTVNSITPSDVNLQCSIQVTGTKISESNKIAETNFIETITFDATDNTKYQTLAKFYDITLISINHVNSNISAIDYDIHVLGYVDFLNSNVKIIGYRSEILGDLNSGNADIRLSLIRIKQNDPVTTLLNIEDIEIDGNFGGGNGKIIDHQRTGSNDRTYEVTSGTDLWPPNSYFVLKMTDFNTYFTNQENYIEGANNEGILIKIDSTNLGPSNGPRFITIQVYYESF